jgi:integrase
VRADKKRNVPVVMTREAVAAIISRIDGTAQLVANLLYGSGVRSREAGRLRAKDLDDPMQPRTVRSGQGDKDRCSTVPATLPPLLQTTWPGARRGLSRTWLRGMARSPGPMRWLGSLRMPPRHRAGRRSFPPGTSPVTRVPVSPAASTRTPASSPRPSRWPSAVPG